MRKVFFISTMNTSVTYYRMVAYIQKMSELDLVHSRLYPEWEPKKYQPMFWEKDMEKSLPVIEEMVDWADMVICQYVSTAQGVSLIEGIRDMKPCFMECDDYFTSVPEYSGAFHDNKPGDRQDYWATRQLMESTGAISPTQYLANFFSKYNPLTKIIPNCIDFNLWGNGERKSNKNGIHIGWVGGGSHSGDLKIIKEVIYRILKEYPNVKVTIICGMPVNWEKTDRLNLIHEYKGIMDYPKMVKGYKFDIGLAPLRDNYFNRGKSNLRYLEYSAMGLPTVASNVEPFKKDFVGLIAHDEDEWYQHLSKLIKEEDYRLELGRKAYDYVYENFNLTEISKKYAEFIKGVVNDSRTNS